MRQGAERQRRKPGIRISRARSPLIRPGNLWVGDSGRLVELDPSGDYLTQVGVPGGGGAVKSLAIDSADFFYLKSQTFAGVRKYELSGGVLIQVQAFDEADRAEALALDSEARRLGGGLQVGWRGSRVAFPIASRPSTPAGGQLTQFGSGRCWASRVLTATAAATRWRSTTPAASLYVASSERRQQLRPALRPPRARPAPRSPAHRGPPAHHDHPRRLAEPRGHTDHLPLRIRHHRLLRAKKNPGPSTLSTTPRSRPRRLRSRSGLARTSKA